MIQVTLDPPKLLKVGDKVHTKHPITKEPQVWVITEVEVQYTNGSGKFTGKLVSGPPGPSKPVSFPEDLPTYPE